MNQLIGVLFMLGGIYGIFAIKNDWPVKISPQKSKLGQYIMNDLFDESLSRLINYAISWSLVGFGVITFLGVVNFTSP